VPFARGRDSLTSCFIFVLDALTAYISMPMCTVFFDGLDNWRMPR